jgi:hypothetical protein
MAFGDYWVVRRCRAVWNPIQNDKVSLESLLVTSMMAGEVFHWGMFPTPLTLSS